MSNTMEDRTNHGSVVIYESLYAAVKGLSCELRAEIFTAIMEYGLYGTEDLKGKHEVVHAIFTLVKPQIDANIRKREVSVKNGRKNSKAEKNNDVSANSSTFVRDESAPVAMEDNLTDTQPTPSDNLTNSCKQPADNVKYKTLNNNNDSKIKTTPPPILKKINNLQKNAPPVSAHPPIEERKTMFYNELSDYTKSYKPEMLKAFFEYWSEPTIGKTKKMKKELQKTWDTASRLSTWERRQFDNNIQFNNINYNDKRSNTRANKNGPVNTLQGENFETML
ncbi:MAG: DUF6291 domain-containing protein [Rikenellaceae bacterium]